jgi:hypothetical protein
MINGFDHRSAETISDLAIIEFQNLCVPDLAVRLPDRRITSGLVVGA